MVIGFISCLLLMILLIMFVKSLRTFSLSWSKLDLRRAIAGSGVASASSVALDVVASLLFANSFIIETLY